MKICKEYGLYDLMKNSWSGAIDTLKTVQEYGKEDELMDFLEEYFGTEIPTETEVNDFLSFNDDYIFEALEIDTDEDEEEEESDIAYLYSFMPREE